ncbi:hypothetical protein BDZ89DRAFT_1144099 [Hymenopellis radicata]|nr:hypothetical protein BDZ89DRAFT_1144099 [Hymenopellis radicata]
MPASRSTTTKVARVGTRRSPRHAKPSKTASSTTASSGAVACTNPMLITPPASVTPASHSAPSRKKLLPSNYVPPRPRNAFLIFRGQVDLQAKTSGLPRSAISKIAGKLWRALSKHIRGTKFPRLRKELRKSFEEIQFPQYVPGPRKPDFLEWGKF